MRTLVRLCVLALLASCAPDLTSSGSGGRMSMALPSFDISSFAGQAGRSDDERFRVTRGRVRIFVVGTANPILDRGFNPDVLDANGRLEVTFPIPAGSETATFEFLVEVFNASDERLFAVGPANFTMGSTGRDATVNATAEYVGPGVGVTSVALDQTALTMNAGDVTAVRCLGALSTGGTTETFPRFFSSSNETVATVDGAGRITGQSPGTASIRCTHDVPPGTSAAVEVTVRDRASTIDVQGNGQTAFTATRLAEPIRVRVTGVRGAPIAGATVQFSVAATSGQAEPATATTDADGRAETAWTLGATAGAQSMTVSVAGIPTTRTVTATATTPPPGGIQGVVRSATSANPVSAQATIVVRAGADATAGAIIATVTSTLSTGAFTVPDLPPGPYTLSVTANGYAPGRRTVAVRPGPQNTVADIVLSPNAALGQIRIVLTWGDTPADLDALLQIPSGRVISWFDLGTCSATPFACLDVDETNGRGPETITIAQTLPGTYIFAVDNYTAQTANAPATDRSLSNSGAVVDVYNGSARIASFAVPPNRAGLQWQVFSYSQGAVTPINTFSAGGTGSSLRSDGAAKK